MKIKNIKKIDCEYCEGNIDIMQIDFEIDKNQLALMDAIFLDVRDHDDSIINDFLEKDKPIVVCCHRGIRSKRLVQNLRSRGFNNFYSFKGGASLL